jgi:hypothetical protein
MILCYCPNKAISAADQLSNGQSTVISAPVHTIIKEIKKKIGLKKYPAFFLFLRNNRSPAQEILHEMAIYCY